MSETSESFYAPDIESDDQSLESAYSKEESGDALGWSSAFSSGLGSSQCPELLSDDEDTTYRPGIQGAQQSWEQRIGVEE